MKFGPPGLTEQQAREHLARVREEGHNPAKVAEHIPEGGNELAQMHERLRDTIADERRNLSEVRRNL